MAAAAPGLDRRAFLRDSAGGFALGSLLSLGADLRAAQAEVRQLKIARGRQVPSVCPYCAVGCGQLVTARDGQIINIEGNPDSPINQGTLCPKGAATYQLAVNPHRVTQVWYRAAGATEWDKTKTLDWAMERIAALVKRTRDETFREVWEREGVGAWEREGVSAWESESVEAPEDEPPSGAFTLSRSHASALSLPHASPLPRSHARVNHTLAIASLGGATMDNEWNYLQAKLMRALGVVFIENQARI